MNLSGISATKKRNGLQISCLQAVRSVKVPFWPPPLVAYSRVYQAT